ncbi:MAG: PepSY-like domain-containing protein [Gemmatimonadaceae bacterium]
MTTRRALGTLLVLAACAGEREEDISADAVPAPVMSAVRARFPNASVTGAARESEDGKTFYEVSLQDGSRKIDVTATPGGDITTIEGALALTDLPAAVTRALSAKYPNAELRIIEDVITSEGGSSRLAYYEVLLETVDKRFVEVQIDPVGKILKGERKASVTA